MSADLFLTHCGRSKPRAFTSFARCPPSFRAGDAVFHRQGLLGDGAPGAKGLSPGKIPFPLLHIDTTYKFGEMIEFRDRFCASIGAQLIVHTNRQAIDDGASPSSWGRRSAADN